MDKLDQLAIVIKMSTPENTNCDVLEYEAKIRGITKETIDNYILCIQQETPYETGPILTQSARIVAEGFMKYRTAQNTRTQKNIPRQAYESQPRKAQQYNPSFLENIACFFRKPQHI